MTTGGTPSVACFKHPTVPRVSVHVKHSAAVLYCRVFRVPALVKCLLLRSSVPSRPSVQEPGNVPGRSACCTLPARGSGLWPGVQHALRDQAEPKGLSPGPRFLEKSQEPRVCSEFLKMIIAESVTGHQKYRDGGGRIRPAATH